MLVPLRNTNNDAVVDDSGHGTEDYFDENNDSVMNDQYSYDHIIYNAATETDIAGPNGKVLVYRVGINVDTVDGIGSFVEATDISIVNRPSDEKEVDPSIDLNGENYGNTINYNTDNYSVNNHHTNEPCDVCVCDNADNKRGGNLDDDIVTTNINKSFNMLDMYNPNNNKHVGSNTYHTTCASSSIYSNINSKNSNVKSWTIISTSRSES